MSAPWTTGLPLVRVAQSADAKRITLIYPFYENQDFLDQHLGWWGTYPPWLRAQLSVIVVDD